MGGTQCVSVCPGLYPCRTQSKGAHTNPGLARTTDPAARTLNAGKTVTQQRVCVRLGSQGDPYSFCKQGECEHDHECAHTLACFDYHCKDPCIGTCGQGAVCKVQDHRPVCSCPSGFKGDPLAACKRRIVVGARKKPTPVQEPRSIIVIGQQYTPDGGSREVQQTIEGRSLSRGRSRSVAVIGSTRKRRFLNLIKALSREE